MDKRSLPLLATLLLTLGGGSQHIGGRVRGFSALENESPTLASEHPGRSARTFPGTVHRSVRTHATRSEKRPTLCSPSHWREAATADDLWIITRESGGDVHAWNPVPAATGHAFGLGQLTDTVRYATAARLGVAANSTNPCVQLLLLRGYVAQRYGTVRAAVEHWREHGWY